MKRRSFLVTISAALAAGQRVFAEVVAPLFKVSLREAHKGTLDIDTSLLDSYGKPPTNLREFYLKAREIFASDRTADFTHEAIINAAAENDVALLGGPMLGSLTSEGVTIWARPRANAPLTVVIDGRTWTAKPSRPGDAVRIKVDGLQPNSRFNYSIRQSDEQIASGEFTTAPEPAADSEFRIAFGSCCHKIGVHNPNLFGQIIARRPHAMMLLGDIAADDRNNEVNMHRADYQLRDVSTPWRNFVANVPVFTSWDDHDYFDNDLSGIPKKFNANDRDAVRDVWKENWNNPERPENQQGIYFNHRMGPVEIIMLDTRSCREGKRRRNYGSYLGREQMEWLKQTLKRSTAPFKIISSGTMWSDYVSNGKDSWGTWDTEGREEIFSLIEEEKIGGVLLVSGDRHGARAFRIPRSSGFAFHEFEPATLGGVSGPGGIVKDCSDQIFGYNGGDFVAFGEFTFDSASDSPSVTFRLIQETGEIREEHTFPLSQLTP